MRKYNVTSAKISKAVSKESFHDSWNKTKLHLNACKQRIFSGKSNL